MRVLVVHNRYRQRGGEDAVVEEECDLLEARGHRVERLIVDNDAARARSTGFAAARLALETVWSRPATRHVDAVLGAFKPDVMHAHNTFPLLSPAIYYTAHAAGVPVVQTLHNFRLLCPNALLYRDGRVCHDCVGKLAPWPGVLRGCYRDSRAQTGVAATMLTTHRVLGAWTRKVEVYIALTDFTRRLFMSGGLPAERIVVKPNFLSRDPGIRAGDGDYCLYVGRLTPEKGIRALLAAWTLLDDPPPLRILGDGPLAGEVAYAARSQPAIAVHGQLARAEALAQLRGARLLIFPSEWHENFPMVIVEAFACGVPVLASRIGGIPEIVPDGGPGWLFTPGDPAALAAAVRHVWNDAALTRAAGHMARRAFETHYSADRQHQQLTGVYERALMSASKRAI